MTQVTNNALKPMAAGTIKANLTGGSAQPTDSTIRVVGDAITQADVTLASAATVNIGGAASNSISITGTTTITAFDNVAAGIVRTLKFSGALVLTHNGTSLKLPTSANITTAAGDVAEFESLGSGNWVCIGYMTASGAALVSSTGSVAYGSVAATGTTQGTAASIGSYTFVVISSATAGSATGLSLGTTVVNKAISFVNPTLVDCTIYPATGSSIDALAANAGYVIPALSFVQFMGKTTTTWQSFAKALKSGAPQIFTSSGTYTPTPGMVFCDIEGVGGGGGGGGTTTTGAAQFSVAPGGGGGGYFKKRLTAAQVGSSAAVVIGSAGAGGSTVGGSGGTGGITTVTCSGSFGTVLTGNGGAGSGGAPVSTGFGVYVGNNTIAATGTGGDSSRPGGTGGVSFTFGSTASLSVSGAGGESFFGAGGAPSYQSAGKVGTGYGAGGGGGALSASQSGVSGGAGIQGAVYVTEYFY